MLKFLFWSLVAVNGALLAYGQGYLGHFSGNEREPERLLKQQNADKLTVISAEQASAAVEAQKTPPPPPPPEPEKKAEKAEKVVEKVEKIACYEVGVFAQAEARKFEAQTARLKLGDRLTRISVPSTEVSSYIVHIPPQGGKEGAEKRAAELRELGVTNYFIMSDSANMRYAISLGVFKNETAAQNLLASLQKDGVRGARLTPRMSPSKQSSYQFRAITPQEKAQLDKLRNAADKDGKSCK